jgi:hypothetical protein
MGLSVRRFFRRSLPLLAVSVSVAACGSGAATPVAAEHTATPASASPTGKRPVDGPSVPASAAPNATATPAATRTGSAAASAPCRDAVQAEQALQASQARDQSNRSALDQDFTAFANRLAADAQKETDPATAEAMTNLSTDYTDLVESQTGGAELPAMTTVQDDGTAFEQACAS